MHELAEKYLTVAIAKVCECDLVKTLVRLVYAVALALILQVLILTYLALRLSSGGLKL